LLRHDRLLLAILELVRGFEEQDEVP